MKSVLISIKPKYCELIANGKKTVEVRKTAPKIATPFKVYIYCTKNKRQWLRKLGTYAGERFITENKDVLGMTEKVKSLIGEGATFWEIGGYNGKVIGEFICDEILDCRDVNMDDTCLTVEEWLKYTKGHKGVVYGWHISNLVIYDKPRELGEFSNGSSRLEFSNTEDGFPWKWSGMKRPPQSWCYVESEVDAEC